MNDQEIALVDHVLTTTRAIRIKYDFDRPVARELVEHCLRIAFQAPNSGNRQNWTWVVVSDPETKRHMADLYRAGMAWNNRALKEKPADGRLSAADFADALRDLRANPPSGERRITADVEDPSLGPGGNGLALYGQPADHIGPSRGSEFYCMNLERMPLLLVPAFSVKNRQDFAESPFLMGSGWGSICQAVWSFMLALRARGLGSLWGTVHLHFEREMAALLGLPDEFVQAGLFPIGYTTSTDFGLGDRTRSEQSFFWERWGSRD